MKLHHAVLAAALIGGVVLACVGVAGEMDAQSRTPPPAKVAMHLLLALVVIIAAARAVGALFSRIGQPPVIGEVVTGIMLGPSVLGWAAPGVAQLLLPPAIAPVLGVVAQLGVTLFMFVVGVHLDVGQLRRHSRASVLISQASIVVPFLLGALLGVFLHPALAPPGVPLHLFALFMGVAMSVTAFPVLARILIDRGLQHSRIGGIALACAATNDVIAWCLLALVVGIAQAQPERVLVTVTLSVCFVAAMLLFVRPLVLRLAAHYERGGMSTQAMLGVACVGLLASALATEAIGIHSLFGAFLFGTLVPHDSPLARDLRDRLEDAVVVLLLPAFFAFAGMRTQIGLLDSTADWAVCGLIVLVASAGKFGGSALAARWAGLGWRQSASIGVLMNTRGLMELIVLNVGLDLGVISPALFAMLVVMALVTTMATTPVLALLKPGEVFGTAQKPSRPVRNVLETP